MPTLTALASAADNICFASSSARLVYVRGMSPSPDKILKRGSLWPGAISRLHCRAANRAASRTHQGTATLGRVEPKSRLQRMLVPYGTCSNCLRRPTGWEVGPDRDVLDQVTLATGVSGFISYDLCKLAGRVPRPSFTFLFQGASMRCFVSSSIDLGSRFR